MEVVVLHSDIARLILGYLKNQKLDEASRELCKTSPYLKQEFSAFKHGFQLHSFFPNLEEIIGEYVKISRKVDEILPKLPAEMCADLRNKKLSEKVSEMFEKILAPSSNCLPGVNKSKPSDRPTMDKSSAAAAVSAAHSDKENNNIAVNGNTVISRKRKRLSSPVSADGTACPKHHHPHKRRRAFTNFYFVSANSSMNVSLNNPNDSDSASDSGDDEHSMPENVEAASTPVVRKSREQVAEKVMPSASAGAHQNSSIGGGGIGGGGAESRVEVALQQVPVEPVISYPYFESSGLLLPSGSCIPPRTPYLARSAGHGDGAGQDPTMPNLESLIDPNFSVSKLIVLNESLAKQSGTEQTEENLNQIATDGQVDDSIYFDAATGQLTFTLTSFPFLTNNEMLAQHLQLENFSNIDAPRFEISLPEPISLTADQLPPNAIINYSSRKTHDDLNESAVGLNATVEENQNQLEPHEGQSVEVPEQSGQPTERQTKETQTDIKLGRNTSTISTHPGSVDFSRILMGKVTPSPCGVVNKTAFRSLSTPRKRPSHVRTLTFSPHVGKAASKTDTDIALVRNVETLPKPPPEVVEDDNVVQRTGTETDVNASGSGPEKSSHDHETPKRKSLSKASVMACRRQISQDKKEVANEETDVSGKVGEEGAIEDDENKSDQTMMEWKRLRSATKTDFEVYLRELNAKKTKPKPPKREPRKRGRPRKDLKSTDVDAGVATSASLCEVDNYCVDSNLSWKSEQDSVKAQEKDTEEVEKTCTKRVKTIAAGGKKRESRGKQKEFSIKIPTPHKSAMSKRVQEKKKEETITEVREEIDGPRGTAGEEAEGVNDSAEGVANVGGKAVPELSRPKGKSSLDKENVDSKTAPAIFQAPSAPALSSTTTTTATNQAALKVQLSEMRTANIACLLDTPFKDAPVAGLVPPTPGIPTSFDTPKPRLLNDETLTTSMLFGSLSKSEMGTPMLSAITPGFRLSPFGSVKDVTPKSEATPDYSSAGSSYYKPDENVDLDRNIDRILRDSTQKRREAEISGSETPRVVEEEVSPPPIRGRDDEVTVAETEEEGDEEIAVQKGYCVVTVPAEKLLVEPLVLQRVKTQDGAGCPGTREEGAPSADVHYKLVPGIPEIISTEEILEETSNMSSSSSSSPSSRRSSSSRSRSSSSSSSSSDSSSSTSEGSQTVIATRRRDLSPLENLRQSLMNDLSEISSNEDTDWDKATDPYVDDDSQLVSNDGEVRYPVRSWLTPKKMTEQVSPQDRPITVRVALPLKSSEKRNTELETKRLRMKQKLQSDRHEPVKTTPTSGRRMMQSRISAAAQKRSAAKGGTVEARSKTPEREEESRKIDVLTALNLSAKKMPRIELTNVQKKLQPSSSRPPPSDIDDNAVAHVIGKSGAKATHSVESKMTRSVVKKLVPDGVNTKGQRKCLLVDPEPIGKAAQQIKAKMATAGASAGAGKGKNARSPTRSAAPASSKAANDKARDSRVKKRATTPSAAVGKAKASTKKATAVGQKKTKPKEEEQEENDDRPNMPRLVAPVPKVNVKNFPKNGPVAIRTVSPRAPTDEPTEVKRKDAEKPKAKITTPEPPMQSPPPIDWEEKSEATINSIVTTPAARVAIASDEKQIGDYEKVEEEKQHEDKSPDVKDSAEPLKCSVDLSPSPPKPVDNKPEDKAGATKIAIGGDKSSSVEDSAEPLRSSEDPSISLSPAPPLPPAPPLLIVPPPLPTTPAPNDVTKPSTIECEPQCSDDDDDESDDPRYDLEIAASHHSGHHHTSIVYEGPDIDTRVDEVTVTRCEHSVCFEDGEIHFINCTEEPIVFFDQAPSNETQARAETVIPKKRKMRICAKPIIVGQQRRREEDKAKSPAPTISKVSTKQRTDEGRATTETPRAAGSPTKQSPMGAEKETKTAVAATSSTSAANRDSAEVLPVDVAEKIKINDIETILSRLHGRHSSSSSDSPRK